MGDPAFYNSIVTYHAIIIIFFMVMPTLIGFGGNWILPLIYKGPDLIFPRINNLSFWMAFWGGILILHSLTHGGGSGAGTGWTLYPPLSTNQGNSRKRVDLLIFRLHITGIGSLLGSINFLTRITIIKQKGEDYKKIPLYIWSQLITNALLVASLPVLAGGLTILIFDRNLNTCFFEPAGGGDPILFQGIFWFFGHPEVYILILPAFGVISTISIVILNKKIAFGKQSISLAISIICFLGCVVWAHHMYTVGIDIDTRIYFRRRTAVIAIPTGVKVLRWVSAIWGGGKRNYTATSLWLIGFLVIFTVGGATGILLRRASLDILAHDTYFVTAHFHFVLRIGAVFGIINIINSWFPRINGFPSSPTPALTQFFALFTGVNLTFFPLHIAGAQGIPRRYCTYPKFLQKWHIIRTFGSLLGNNALTLYIDVWILSVFTQARFTKLPFFNHNLPNEPSLLHANKSSPLLFSNWNDWRLLIPTCLTASSKLKFYCNMAL